MTTFDTILSEKENLPPLETGDRLDQPAFHARYQAMSNETQAELVGGIVYMLSALKMPHGRYHMLLNLWLAEYWRNTRGTDALDNASVILGDQSEVQPDACLLVKGGQTSENEEGYCVGPPEFVAEIASASESYDLHAKRDDYERHGVQEYLVLVLREKRVVWFVRQNDEFVALEPDKNGILKSRLFAGLWLDAEAFFQIDADRLQSVLGEGLNSGEHAEFVKRLGSQ